MAPNPRGGVTPDAPQSGWRVTGQQETIELGPGNQPVAGIKITFMTETGVEASVFLTHAAYSPDNVRAAIAAKAHQIDQVSNLSG